MDKKVNTTLGKNKTQSKTVNGTAEDTEGSALFEYIDDETGLSQKFAFNLRYYLGASSVKLKKAKKPKRNTKLNMTKEEIEKDKLAEEKEKKEE
jgi:hypothetical protein